ncbi:MAG: RidA family protein [Flavobacteriaceae bacterium]
MKQIINTPNAPAPIGPYNQAVWAQNTLYISGQIGLDPQTMELQNSTIAIETRQVLDNLSAILTAAGLDRTAVVKTSIFLSDMELFSEVNEVYGQYFEEANAPARETVAVKALPKYVNVEISAIAVRL